MKPMIGDIYFAQIDNHFKRYFQYVCNDRTQLNSDVIRIFSKKYSLEETPKLSEIILGEVKLYAHCLLKIGSKMNLWVKYGNCEDVGDIANIVFRNTNDYGSKTGDNFIATSNDWYIWKINDKNSVKVDAFNLKKNNTHIGLIFSPNGIIEILKGNSYPMNYPRYE